MNRNFIIVIIYLSLIMWCNILKAIDEVKPEYKIIAAYLYKFAEFVNWPKDAFPDEKAPIIIGVLGENPFGDGLRSSIEQKKAKGRSFEVRNFNKIEDLQPCHILYISRQEEGNLKVILNKIKDQSVLTVSDMVKFAENGGVIGFYFYKKKHQFEININAAKNGKLTINSLLFKVAKRIIKGDF